MSEESPSSGPRDIFSTRPFWNSSREYYRKGFLPLPLPPKDKNPPPTGSTGHNPKFEIDADQIDAWMDDPAYTKSNIGVKLSTVTVDDKEYIVIGIDVDNYEDFVKDGDTGEKKLRHKEGGAQLAELEERLGKLPETWISSARADGVSGIRFFLAPTDLQWRGKAAESIDVIQPGHRFAVVWPSWHPKGGQYLFTQPGQVPDGTLPNLVGYRATPVKLKPGQSAKNGRAVSFTEEPIRIPDARDFPLLPDAWIDFLTRDRTPFVDSPMNMDLSVEEMERWAKNSMRKGKPCKELKARVEHWKKRIEEDPASHDKVLGFHWQLAQMGLAEGHSGCWTAIKEMNDFWMKAVQQAGKRGVSQAGAEIFRSKINAFRKVRYAVDEMEAVGAVPPKTCRCAVEVDPEQVAKEIEEKDQLPKPPGKIKDVEDYQKNDWGRSEMFLDMYTVDRVKCVGAHGSEVKWYFWELDGSPTRKSRGWVQDNDLAVRLMRGPARVYEAKYDQLVQQYRELRQKDPEEAKKMWQDRVRPARMEADRMGNVPVTNALMKMAQSHEGVRVPDTFFDNDKTLLGFDDGLVVLERGRPWKFREKKFGDRVTKSVGLPFRTMDELVKSGDPGATLLADYLQMFIPDSELATFVQMILGYALYGSNPHRKLFFFYGDTGTGKSTIVESFVSAMGEYGSTSNIEIFQDENGGRNPELLKTRGKRVVQLPEFGDSQYITNDVLKRLASVDTTSVRDNYAKSDQIVEFQQSATFIGPTNNVPKINSVDPAVIFRTVVVPFDQKFTENYINTDKIDAMKTFARSAVLAWALEGWNKFVEGEGKAFEHSKLPPLVRSTTRNFLGQMSEIGEFLDDYVERTDNPGDILTTNALYSLYTVWAEREGTPKGKVYTKTRLTRSVNAHFGIVAEQKKISGENLRVWVGYKISKRSGALKNSPFTVADPVVGQIQVGEE